jgi:hypothetical protein
MRVLGVIYCVTWYCSAVPEADRLLDHALTWFHNAVLRRPDDDSTVLAYAFHLCGSIRDASVLDDTASPEYSAFWYVVLHSSSCRPLPC